MSKAQHTPTPWRVGKTGAVVADSKIATHSESGNVQAYGGALVCESLKGANAAHIVKCVNLHDELVEALETVEADYGHFDPEINADGSEFYTISKSTLGLVQNVLAKARSAGEA